MLPTAVSPHSSGVLGCTPLWKFLLSNLRPTRTLSALGFGVLFRYSGSWVSQGSRSERLPAEACGSPHSPTSRDVWEAGRESSRQQVGWTRGVGDIRLSSGLAKSQKAGSVAEGGGHHTKTW